MESSKSASKIQSGQIEILLEGHLWVKMRFFYEIECIFVLISGHVLWQTHSSQVSHCSITLYHITA